MLISKQKSSPPFPAQWLQRPVPPPPSWLAWCLVQGHLYKRLSISLPLLQLLWGHLTADKVGEGGLVRIIVSSVCSFRIACLSVRPLVRKCQSNEDKIAVSRIVEKPGTGTQLNNELWYRTSTNFLVAAPEGSTPLKQNPAIWRDRKPVSSFPENVC
jgi:hypothetical protein